MNVHEADEQMAAENLLVVLESEGCPVGFGMQSVLRIFHHTDTEPRVNTPPIPADFPRLELTDISGAPDRLCAPSRGWTAVVQTSIGPVAVCAERFVGIEELGGNPVVPLGRLANGSFGAHLQFREGEPLLILAPDFLAERVQEKTA